MSLATTRGDECGGPTLLVDVARYDAVYRGVGLLGVGFLEPGFLEAGFPGVGLLALGLFVLVVR